MSQYSTDFAAIDEYSSGSITVIGKDNKKNYVFSNMFEVAANSAPYERVAIAKNFEYVVESMRARVLRPGTPPRTTSSPSPWTIRSR